MGDSVLVQPAARRAQHSPLPATMVVAKRVAGIRAQAESLLGDTHRLGRAPVPVERRRVGSRTRTPEETLRAEKKPQAEVPGASPAKGDRAAEPQFYFGDVSGR